VHSHHLVLRLATDGSGSICVRNASPRASHLHLDVSGHFQ